MKTLIKENFLDHEEFVKLKRVTLLEPMFPLYLSIDNKNNVDDDTFCFQHTFYDGRPNSDWYSTHIQSIVDKLEVKTLLRVRAVYYTINQQIQKGSFHTDFNVPHKTSILFLNTNNGYTEFEDDTKVESISNRCVTFDGLKKHRGVTQTDTKLRVLLNINYL